MPGHVCQLLKSIYGFRQAGEIWEHVVHVKIFQWGFKQSDQDRKLYFNKKGNYFINRILVVDDMGFPSNSSNLISRFNYLLSNTFKVELLGKLKFFIGLEINWSDYDLYIAQKLYIKKPLENQNMEHVEPLDTPLPIKCDLSPIQEHE